MDRRLGLWVSAVGGLLAVTLVAAPIWDFWRYRSLRAPLGPHVPVGVILPLRSVPPPLPAQAPERQAPAAARFASVAAPEPARSGVEAHAAPHPGPGANPMRPGVPTATLIAGFASPGGTATTSDPARAHSVPVSRPVEMAPARPASLPATSIPGDRLQERTAAAASSANAPADSAGTFVPGWPAAPAPEPAPQLPPEPRHGTAPPPPVTSPGNTAADPVETTPVIPMLTLTPPAGAVKAGDAFSVTVRLTTGTSVSSLPFHVDFDPAVLQFQSAERGPAIGAAMQTILLASVSPARPGDLAVGLSVVDSGPMLHGSGTVLRLNFLALAPGSTALAFDRASIRGNMSEPLEAQFHDTRIDVH